MPAEFSSSTPRTKESAAIERAKHTQVIKDTAYLIHQRRYLLAEGDPYQTRVIQRTPSDVLAERDWLLAKSIVDEGNPDNLTRLRTEFDELLAKREEIVVFPEDKIKRA